MRLPTTGTIRVDGVSYAVSGDAWLDREWSTSALGADQVGWDWFALQLDDGSELMFYQLRRRDGTADPASKGVLVAGDGERTDVRAADVVLETTRTWRSPRTAADYPAGWRLAVPAAAVALEITPLLADQELPTTVVYWEGAVRVQGTIAGRDVRGYGYVELTGYADDAAASPGR
jgi:predicted secreted hydrolase